MRTSWGARQVHRWIAVAFTLSVITNIVTFAVDDPPEWIAYLALPPLLVLFASGAVLFVLPYRRTRRAGQLAD